MILISKKAIKSLKKLHENQAPAPAPEKKLNLKSSKLWLHQKKLEPKSLALAPPKKIWSQKAWICLPKKFWSKKAWLQLPPKNKA